MNSEGQSLELFFINGKPDGMLTASVFNWTGHVLVAPRTQLREALKRSEANRTGIYILVGEKDDEPLAYIGEGENIGKRLRSHEVEKDWWDKMVLITSASNDLNKAHVKYLEARLIKEAKQAGKITLENNTAPDPSGLSEASQSNIEVFLNYILLVLPAARIDFLLKDTRPETDKSVRTDKAEVVFEFKIPKHNIQATAKLEGGEFVVQKGSLTQKKWSEKQSHHNYKKLFDQLVVERILCEDKNHPYHHIFKENYKFNSPSAAAAVIAGQPGNGRKRWKIYGSKKTYEEWEAESLKQSVKVKDFE